MQLRSSRWYGVWVAISLGLMLFPTILIAFGVYALLVPAVPVAIFFLLPQRTVAALDGTTLWIGGKSAPIGDLLSVRSKSKRILFVPVWRTLIFVVKPGARDKLTERAMGARKVRLRVQTVEGGRAACDAFVAQALAVSNGRATAPPRTGLAPRAAMPRFEEAAPSDNGFDPDAIIARYLAGREAEAAPAAAPMRPGFGRKGL